MSFTHRVVLPLAGIAAALSMVTIGLAAETTPPTPAGPAGLPVACQLDDDASATKTPTATVTSTATTTTTAAVTTTATPTPTVASDDDENDDDFEMKGNHSDAVRACIEALRAEGQHGFGQIISRIAQDNAERREHERERDDDNASTATATATATTTATTTTTPTTTTTTANVTGTPTATTGAEHHGRHTPPQTHHGD
jgi:hypothetical protein